MIVATSFLWHKAEIDFQKADKQSVLKFIRQYENDNAKNAKLVRVLCYSTVALTTLVSAGLVRAMFLSGISDWRLAIPAIPALYVMLTHLKTNY